MSATVWMTPAALELLREELATLEAASRDDDPTTRARIVELRERIAAADTTPAARRRPRGARHARRGAAGWGRCPACLRVG